MQPRWGRLCAFFSFVRACLVAALLRVTTHTSHHLLLSCWTFLQPPTNTTTSHPQMSLFPFCCPAPQPATAIRQYLCLSLLKNSASSIPAALQLSASIFLSLLQKFRSALKAEVGVFFPMVMLKVGCGALGSNCLTRI